jgi:hypothetical protein
MRISHKHRFVFLAYPRTGSTSIRKILDNYSDVKSIYIAETSKKFPFYHHISASELKSIFDNRGWKWHSYKKFCVVRNPYDRVVSLFHHSKIMKARMLETHGLFYYFLRKAKDIIKPTNSFTDYVMQITPNNRLAAPLRNFICSDRGDFLVEDILMYETFTVELPGYLRKLDLSIVSEDIPLLNCSQNRKEYRQYYNEKTKEKISNLYAYEINRFGYKF